LDTRIDSPNLFLAEKILAQWRLACITGLAHRLQAKATAALGNAPNVVRRTTVI